MIVLVNAYQLWHDLSSQVKKHQTEIRQIAAFLLHNLKTVKYLWVKKWPP